MSIRVGSLFAGIGGFDLGFERAGFEVAWCVEWDKAAQAVLRKRFPNAQVYGDIQEVDPDKLQRVDVICGGFPCQDLSVAGKRAGLAGERSGLFHDAMRIVRAIRPRLLVLENVPGLLSSNNGLDFATVLREVGEGWDCQEVGWRVLDSQYFGVAQRRRRVFIVGSSRIGCAEEVLALAESSGGDPPSRGKAREAAAADAERRADGGRWWDGSDCAATLTKQNATLQDRENRQGGHTHLIAQAFRKSKRAQSAEDDETWVDDGVANTLNGFDTGDARTTHAVAYGLDEEQNGAVELMGTLKARKEGGGFEAAVATVGVCVTGDGTHSLTSNGADASEDGTGRGTPIGFIPKVHSSMVVRRLTPVECERLQGFPDGWTQIGTDKPTADSHRYKQLGNAVTVNVAEWIARNAWKVLSEDTNKMMED